MHSIRLGDDHRTARAHRSAYRRFRCRSCGKPFNERTDTVLNRAQYPSDVIACELSMLRKRRGGDIWRLRWDS